MKSKIKKDEFYTRIILEILLTIAKEKDGYRQLLKLSLEAIMRVERKQFNQIHRDYSNGYRFSNVCVYNGKMELVIPRSRHNNFYPLILALIKDQNKESEELAFELYPKGYIIERFFKMLSIICIH